MLLLGLRGEQFFRHNGTKIPNISTFNEITYNRKVNAHVLKFTLPSKLSHSKDCLCHRRRAQVSQAAVFSLAVHNPPS